MKVLSSGTSGPADHRASNEPAPETFELAELQLVRGNILMALDEPGAVLESWNSGSVSFNM